MENCWLFAQFPMVGSHHSALQMGAGSGNAWSVEGEKDFYYLHEISSLHGTVKSLTHFMAWAHILFFGMQNVIQHELK